MGDGSSDISYFKQLTETSERINRQYAEAREKEIEAAFEEIKAASCQINKLPGGYLLATYRDRLNDKELVKIL